jgi:hypothetical protein
MFELSLIVIGIIVGFFLTRVCDAAVVLKQSHELEEKLKARLTEIKERIINSRIEKVADSLCLYNRDTNEFLGQGKNMDELEENVKRAYPNKLFNVPADQIALYGDEKL